MKRGTHGSTDGIGGDDAVCLHLVDRFDDFLNVHRLVEFHPALENGLHADGCLNLLEIGVLDMLFHLQANVAEGRGLYFDDTRVSTSLRMTAAICGGSS